MDWKDVKEIIAEVEPVLKATSDAVRVLDRYGNTVYENPLYEIMLKRGNAEIVADAKDIYRNGKKAGRVIVYHDISEVNRFVKQFEQARKMMKQMPQMLGKRPGRGGFRFPF